MLVFSRTICMEEIYSALISAVGHRANVYLTGRKGSPYIEVVSREISKKLGIDCVMRHLGLGPEDIAVFGDDYNDLEMLKGFEHSVAMGNADSEIKAAESTLRLVMMRMALPMH